MKQYLRHTSRLLRILGIAAAAAALWLTATYLHVGDAMTRLHALDRVIPLGEIIGFGWMLLLILGVVSLLAWRQLRQERVRHVETAKALQFAESQLQSFADVLPDLIGYADTELRYRFNNAAYQTWFGIPPEAISGLSLRDVLPPAVFAAAKPHFAAVLQGEERTFEGDIALKTGEVRRVIHRLVPHYTDGDVNGFFIVIHDITRMVKTGVITKRAQQLAYRIVDSAVDAVVAFDETGTIREWNRHAEITFGWSRTEILGRSVFETLVPAHRRDAIRADLAEYKASGRSVFVDRRTEIVALHRDGREFHVEASVFALQSSPLLMFSAFVRDITDRITVERDLRESRDRYEVAVRGAGVGIWDWNRDSRILHCSDKMKELLESGNGDCQVRNFWSRIHEDDRPLIKSRIRRHYIAGTPFSVDCRLRTGRGEFRWFNLAGKAILNPEGRVVRMAGSLADITARIAAERALFASEARFRDAFDNAPIGVSLIGLDGRFQAVNRRLADMVGYSPEELKRFTFAHITHPEDLEASAQLADGMRSGRVNRVEFEKRFIRKDGTVIWAKVMSVLHNDGDGAAPYFITQYLDVTKGKLAEQEKAQLEAQLRRAQKLETVGTLAGGIAHDFNNILMPLFGFTEMALRHLPADSRARDDLAHVLRAAERARDLVSQILMFSRQTEQSRQPVRLVPLIKETLRLLRATLPASIEIRTAVQTPNDLVLSDASQIHQVLMNLCTNAFHAMRAGGGVLEITLDDMEIDESYARYHPNLKAGRYVRLAVSDTGHGMDPAVAERIFEPFFTTKPVGEGTGLGLSVVHGIVLRHGGDITVYSERGKGTVFHIYLPAATTERPGETESNGQLPTGSERILYVDDEHEIAVMGRELLEAMGFRVAIQINSTDALDLFRAAPDQFDAVVTDLTMPQMSGETLAAGLLQIRPNIPIVLTTGFSDAAIIERTKSLGIREFILKPFTMRDLGLSVRRAIDGHSNGHGLVPTPEKSL